MPDDDKLNPKVKSTDRSQPYISDTDGKVHIAETEIREDNIEKGSDIYREPKKVEGTVYVQDTSKGSVQLNDEVVVDIDGGTTTKETSTIRNDEVYVTDVNESNSIVAGTDNTRFVQDRGKKQIIYDSDGGNYAKKEKNWKEAYSTRYEKKYKDNWSKALTTGVGAGAAYAVGGKIGNGLFSVFLDLFREKKVYEVEFHYKCHSYDVVESIFIPKDVKEVIGLTQFNTVNSNDKAKKKTTSDITILRDLTISDIKTQIKVDLSAATGKEKGSLFHFFSTLSEFDEYSLNIHISVYNYKPFWFNEYLGEYEIRKARIDSYKLGKVGQEKEPAEQLTVRGYLYQIKEKGGSLLSEAKSAGGSSGLSSGVSEKLKGSVSGKMDGLTGKGGKTNGNNGAAF